jgi:hypothetical protein
MTPSTISQALNNVAAEAQQGGGVVAQATVNFAGGDALLSLSGSAYSAAPGQVSLEVWIDGEPAGEPLWMYANTGEMHLALGRSFINCPGMTAGGHEVTVVAGPTTVTDPNDYVCLTLWELGDGLAASVFDGQGPQGGATGGVFVKERVGTMGEDWVLVSSSGSGWVGQSGGFVQTAVQLDTANPLMVGEVCANNADQHLATVPTDLPFAEMTRGQHLVALSAGPSTDIDQGDYGHVSVLEWVNADDAPMIVTTNPPLQNTPAQGQQGSGGTVAQTSFSSSGGTLLIRLNASAWTSVSGGTPISIGAMLDGSMGSVGVLIVWANFASTHMTLVSNDLVVPNVPAGNHTLTLIGEANTITDLNDRVSVTIMEFPAG